MRGAFLFTLLTASRLPPLLTSELRLRRRAILASVVVGVGLGLMRLTGWVILDSFIACAVAVNILLSGTTLLRQSVSHLMDDSRRVGAAPYCRYPSADSSS